MSKESSKLGRRLRVVALLGAALCPSLAFGQASPETTHGKLTLWSSGIGAAEPIVGAARQKAAAAGEDALVTLLKRNPALADPIGYGVRMHRSDGETFVAKAFGLPFTYGIESWIWYFGWDDDGRGGRTIDMSNGKFGLTVFVNAAGRNGEIDDTLYADHGPPFMRGYKETGRFRGHPVYDGACVFLTRNSAPPLIPVTRERYLTVKMLAARQDSARHLAHQTADGATPMSDNLAQYLRDKPKRDADIRQVYELLKKSDPAGAEKMLAELKKADAESEKQLRASAPEMDRQIREKRVEGNSAVGEALKKVQAELDALSPAERRGPAYIVDLGMNQTRLANSDDSDQVLLVQVNVAAYDKTLAPTVPQVVSVCLPGLQPDFPVPGGNWSAQWARDAVRIRDGLDWAALEAMVKPKP